MRPVTGVTRVLALVCVLPLALPPGWCCMAVACPLPPAPAARHAEPAHDCCGRLKSPAPETPKAPDRQAHCPACLDRDGLPPQPPELPDPGPVALPEPPLAASLGTGGLTPAARPADRPTRDGPLHLLHCVWLC
jgi:hypothetical protein